MAKGNRETKKPKKELVKKTAAAASTKGGTAVMPTLVAGKKK